MTAAIEGDDGLARCPWAATNAVLRAYHDTEWGLAVRDETGLFERLTLEAFQSGLSWLTILNKRPAFREAFAGFDPDAVASFGARDRRRLMADAAIVRNGAKVDATLSNAKAVVALRSEGGLERLIWSHRPEQGPKPRTTDQVPTQSAESKALAKDLKAHGLVFVGPTTAHALMEAIGMIDTHLVGCHRRGCAIT